MSFPEYLLANRKELIQHLQFLMLTSATHVNLYTDETIQGLIDAHEGAEKELPQN